MADVTLDQLNEYIRKLIRVLYGMQENSVRKANQNAPTGGKDDQFATVLITTFDGLGWDVRREQDEAAPSLNVKETVVGQRRFTASIQFFKGDAYSKAVRLEALLQSSKALELMQKNGLGLVRCAPAKNLTAVVDTHFEERGQVDVDFHVVIDHSVSLATYGEATFELYTEKKADPVSQFTDSLDY